MEFFEIISILVIAGIASARLYSFFANKKIQNEIFYQAARQCKCEFSAGTCISQPQFNGSKKGMRLHAEKNSENKEEFLKLSIKYSPSFKGNFSLEEETTISRLQNTLGFKDIQTGDAAFDEAVWISTLQPSLVHAVFNSKTRKQVLKMILGSENFSIKNKAVIISYPFDSIHSDKTLCWKVDLLVATAQMITKTKDIRKSLLQNIETETIPKVIVNNIKSLAANYPKDKETRGILKAALGNEKISVQVEAAFHLGKTGLKHLTTLLKEKEPIPSDLRNKIVTFLGDNRYIPSLPVLEEVYRNRAGFELQKTILKTFEKFEHAKIETFLLEQLNSKETDLRHGAIEALGTCGTAASAEKLYHLAKDSLNPFTKNHAQKAIAQIQSRLGDVEKGWLSVSDSPEAEGALSLSDTSTEGALSIDKKDKK